jgi:FAD/FMN-containing dehydrogenase
MNKKFANIVGAENVSEDMLDLASYSYCSSETELKPEVVVWPKNTEQVQRLLLFANQGRQSVVFRGSGTSTVDGCIGENVLLVSSERMNRVLRFDVKNKIIEVEPGMKITDLNTSLRSLKLIFPLIPFNPAQTVGGMIALNAVTKESQSQGRMIDWVEEVEFVDGTGKSFYTKKKGLVGGQEGISGFITKAKLRIAELPVLSFDVFSFDQITDLLGQARLLKKDKEVYFVEFIDKKTSQELGFGAKYVVSAAYLSLKGKIKNLAEANAVQEKINSVHSKIRSKGYYYAQDPRVALEKAYDLIEWCEKHDARIHGHIGLGIFYVYFQKKDQDVIETFRSFIKRIGGSLGSAFGFGNTNVSFLSQEKKKELMRLKDEHDYNNILNPNKLINYR